MKTNKEKLSIILLVVSAILTLVILSGLYLFLAFNSVYDGETVRYVDSRETETEGDFYDINPDPFLTQYEGGTALINSPIISDDDPSMGASDPKLTIVQYSDFTCKFCHAQEKLIQNIIKKYQDSIKYIRKDYPEGSNNSFSWKSSIAARCAGEQGKYWEYSDRLYENEKKNDNVFIDIANILNFEINRFKDCLVDSGIETLIKNNILEANSLDIKGVPYIFIDDIDFLGEVSEDEIETIIKTKLE